VLIEVGGVKLGDHGCGIALRGAAAAGAAALDCGAAGAVTALKCHPPIACHRVWARI
jgi:hypothetical protein